MAQAGHSRPSDHPKPQKSIKPTLPGPLKSPGYRSSLLLRQFLDVLNDGLHFGLTELFPVRHHELGFTNSFSSFGDELEELAAERFHRIDPGGAAHCPQEETGGDHALD